MKKIISLVALAGMLMLMSFSDKAIEKIEVLKICETYALNAVNSEIAQSGEMSTQDYVDAYYWYKNYCDDNGGNVALPVLVG